jgi:hypothetical protein
MIASNLLLREAKIAFFQVLSSTSTLILTAGGSKSILKQAINRHAKQTLQHLKQFI